MILYICLPTGEGSLRYIGDLDPPMLPASPTTADLPVYKSEAQMMMKLVSGHEWSARSAISQEIVRNYYQ